MKTSSFLLGVFCILLSSNAFSQKKHYWPHHSHHHFSGHHHNTNFAGGLLTGLFLSEVFDIKHKSARKMYFKYKPNKKTWRLTKDISPFVLSYNPKVIARFENPKGGPDFFVTINRRGVWDFDCPKKLRKTLKNKLHKNL